MSIKPWLIYPLLLVTIFISYHNALNMGFVSDDGPQILNNPDIKSWSNFFYLFTVGVWHTDEFTGGIYRPLAFASWLVEYSIVGAKPLLYHIDNIILHFICCYAIYIIVKRLAEDPATPMFAALLFAAHPVHTEAVTWIACRMELMYSLFTLAAFWLFIAKPRTPVYVAASCLLFMAGLLSKETAIVLPVIIFAYLMLYEKQDKGSANIKRIAVLLLPYAITVIFYVAMRLSVIGLVDSAITLIYTNYEHIGRYKMFLTMCQALYEYIRLCFLPFDQKLEYVFAPPAGILNLKVLIALLAVTLPVIFIRRLAHGSRIYLFAILWFFICLLPVSNIIPSGIIMTERAAYLPSVGPSLLLGLAFSKAGKAGSKFIGNVALICFVIVMVLFMRASIHRNNFWIGINHKVIIKLMQERVHTFPDNPINYRLLAETQIIAEDYTPETEETILTGLRMAPDDDQLHFLYAKLLYKQKLFVKSLMAVENAIAIKPSGEYYNFAGGVLQKLGRYAEASKMYESAIRMSPEKAEYRTSMGNLLLETGEDRKSLVMFEKSIELDQSKTDAYLGMGIALDSLGKTDEAVTYIKKAVDIDPKNPDLRYFLANAYLRMGKRDLADSELREALRIKPDYTDAASLLKSIN